MTLRDFEYGLRPMPPVFPASRPRRADDPPVDGLELFAVARDTGLLVSLRFERSEFVNIATAGLLMLDAADATGLPEGGETL